MLFHYDMQTINLPSNSYHCGWQLFADKQSNDGHKNKFGLLKINQMQKIESLLLNLSIWQIAKPNLSGWASINSSSLNRSFITFLVKRLSVHFRILIFNFVKKLSRLAIRFYSQYINLWQFFNPSPWNSSKRTMVCEPDSLF